MNRAKAHREHRKEDRAIERTKHIVFRLKTGKDRDDIHHDKEIGEKPLLLDCVADSPKITESLPMSEEPSSPCCRVYDSPSPEVGERVRAYLEQHGWPEEYEAESLLEHYALIDWLAVQLSFHRPLQPKNFLIYGRINQAKKILLALKTVLRIYFADSSLNSMSRGATNQEDLLVFDDFQLKEEEGALSSLCQVLDGNQSNKAKRVPIILLTPSIPKAIREPGPLQKNGFACLYEILLRS